MRHTPEQRTKALTTYTHHGLAAAHHETGIPRTTIRRWAAEAGITLQPSAQAAAKTAAAREALTAGWEERRAQLIADLADLADRAVRSASTLVETDPAEAKQAAITAGIAIDKAQLLNGDATTRSEHTELDKRQAAERLAKIVNIEAAKRAAA